MFLLDGCQYSGETFSLHLQDRRVVFSPNDEGSKFLRNIGTYSQLHGIALHKNINYKCLDNLKCHVKCLFSITFEGILLELVVYGTVN
jgi:hypothetical protein